MEDLLSNQEFNVLLKETKVERYDFERSLFEESPKSVDEVLEKLKKYWKLVRFILKVAKVITPRKIDKGINEFISIVNRLCKESNEGEEQSKLLDRFAIVWGIILPVLISIKGLTPPKADLIIEEVIKIGELLSKS